MAVAPKQEDPPPAYVDTVHEIMRLYRTLPPRPTIDEVEAAFSVLKTVETQENIRLDEISKQEIPSKDVPEEIFSVLIQVRKATVLFQSHEQKKDALHLVEVDKMHETFDELIQRASGLVLGDTQKENDSFLGYPVEKIGRSSVVSDQSFVKGDDQLEKKDMGKGFSKGPSLKSDIFRGAEEDEKLSLMKVAAIIENSAKTEAILLDLKGKLMDQIEWLPISIGKLSYVTELDLSENRIMALPDTISGLKALTKLDLHSNQLINLPESFAELLNLTDLDLHANRLKSLPASFHNLISLENLDLSLNTFTRLPETIGNMMNLKTLNVETNELEELPYTIGDCASLVELRLDFNQLKALPEAIGKLGFLEILTLHYNRVKGLPTTIGNLVNLKELDASFNEISSVPENFCFAVSLTKLNLGNNFADLKDLPRSIGNLESLEVLDISDNQIRILPDSFRLLSKLRVFRADETPLEVPPRQVAKLGAQAVVEYMTEFVAKKEEKSQAPLEKKKKKSFWLRILSLFKVFSK